MCDGDGIMASQIATAPNCIPTICVVVCTRNRASQLREALESLVHLTTEDAFQLAVLVVDNGSADDTQRVIKQCQAKHPQLHLRSALEPEVGFAYARNRAIREANSDWIAFFDDDQLAEPVWLLELWRLASRRQADCVGGAVKLRLVDEEFSPGELCRALLGETSHAVEERPFDRSFHPGTGSLLIRRTRLVELGGFTTDKPGRGEDTRLFERLTRVGCQSWYCPQAIVEHVIPRERNQPCAYRALARDCADASDIAWRQWGALLPAVTLARFCRLLVIDLPRLGGATVFGSPATRLDRQCQVIMNFWRCVNELAFCGQIGAERIVRRPQGAPRP